MLPAPETHTKEKQAHLQRQRLDAQTRLAHAQAASTQMRDVITEALKLAGNCHHAYQQANATMRRSWNQLWFTKVFIDKTGITDVHHTPEILALNELNRRRQPHPQQTPLHVQNSDPAPYQPQLPTNSQNEDDHQRTRQLVAAGSSCDLLVGEGGPTRRSVGDSPSVELLM